MAGQLEVVFLLSNECIVEVAEVEPLVGAHLDHEDDGGGDGDDDDDDLEDGRWQLDTVGSESLVPLVRLERHKLNLQKFYHQDEDNEL